MFSRRRKYCTRRIPTPADTGFPDSCRLPHIHSTPWGPCTDAWTHTSRGPLWTEMASASQKSPGNVPLTVDRYYVYRHRVHHCRGAAVAQGASDTTIAVRGEMSSCCTQVSRHAYTVSDEPRALINRGSKGRVSCCRSACLVSTQLEDRRPLLPFPTTEAPD